MSGLTIRPASADDIPAVAAIYDHWVATGTSSFELEPPGPEEMLRRFHALADQGLPYLVAERQGRLLGYAYAGYYRPRPAYRFTLEDSIYIAPDAVGQGVGRPLLGALVETARAGGYRNLMAVIGDSGNAASVGLHRALGFDMVGIAREIGFKFDRWLDVVTMQKVL